MPRTPRPQTTPEELAMVCGLAQEVASYLGHDAQDSDAHTSAMIVANWLELLYRQVARRAESQLEGQLPLWRI